MISLKEFEDKVITSIEKVNARRLPLSYYQREEGQYTYREFEPEMFISNESEWWGEDALIIKTQCGFVMYVMTEYCCRPGRIMIACKEAIEGKLIYEDITGKIIKDVKIFSSYGEDREAYDKMEITTQCGLVSSIFAYSCCTDSIFLLSKTYEIK